MINNSISVLDDSYLVESRKRAVFCVFHSLPRSAAAPPLLLSGSTGGLTPYPHNALPVPAPGPGRGEEALA